jgi:hypothetical protein
MPPKTIGSIQFCHKDVLRKQEKKKFENVFGSVKIMSHPVK